MRRSATSSLVSHTEQGSITFTNLLQGHKTVVLVYCTIEWEPDTCNNGKEILMLSYLSSISESREPYNTHLQRTIVLKAKLPHYQTASLMLANKWNSQKLSFKVLTLQPLNFSLITLLFRYRCLKLKMKLWFITWTSWQSFERGVVYWMWGKSPNCNFWAKVGPQYKKSASGYGWYSLQIWVESAN